MPAIDSTPNAPTRAARPRRVIAVCALAVALALVLSLALSAAAQGAARCTKGTTVLRVGTFNGEKGQCATIQEAVNAVEPGGWILIGPGDYKQSGYHPIAGAAGDDLAGADILITTPNIHMRGMNRNTVVIDGTKPGSPQCGAKESDQNFGPAEGSSFLGNNGVVVYKTSGVWLQNFSACNFLGANRGGDSIWFDGGASTGKQGLSSWWGEYLSSTSTYWGGKEPKPSDKYGIYASNTYGGPGIFYETYANNMADSGYYIGACPDCHAVLNRAHSENNDLGYSGSNSAATW